jgi:hypothetical protein
MHYAGSYTIIFLASIYCSFQLQQQILNAAGFKQVFFEFIAQLNNKIMQQVSIVME